MNQNNPLKDVIRKAMTEQEVTRGDLVDLLGYKNRNKGFRKVDDFLANPLKNREILEKVISFLSLEQETVNKAEEETRLRVRQARLEELKQAELAARKAFKPHLKVLHERSRPVSITITCFIGVSRFKVVALPDTVTELVFDEAVNVAGKTAARDFIEKEGCCGMFGTITGYIFQCSYDYGLEMDTEGAVIGPAGPIQNQPRGYLTIGNQEIPDGLFDEGSW